MRDTFHQRKLERTIRYYRDEYGWRLRECTACSGSGYYDHDGSPRCGWCNGTGKTRQRGPKARQWPALYTFYRRKGEVPKRPFETVVKELQETYRKMEECKVKIDEASEKYCDPVYCQLAERMAQDMWGIDTTPMRPDCPPHPPTPYKGYKGCVLAPHLRPLCTAHIDEVAAYDRTKHSPRLEIWRREYYHHLANINDLLREYLVHWTLQKQVWNLISH